MKCIIEFCLIITGVIGVGFMPAVAQNTTPIGISIEMVDYKVEYKYLIRLNGEHSASVARIAFSPDGRYLAILVDNMSTRAADIIVWDLKLDREQSRVESLPMYASPYIKIMWSPDGRYISLGRSGRDWPMQFWNPLTGSVVKELDVSGGIPSVYNKDGSKLLVNTTPLVNLHPVESGYRIYDTSSWSFREYSANGLMVQTLAWTSDGKVILAGVWPKWSVGRTIDGVTPKMSDVLVRRVDPTGEERSHTVILGHGLAMVGRPDIVLAGPVSTSTSTTDYLGNLIALGSGHITVLDTKTLNTLFFYAPSEIESKNGVMPDGALGANVAFSKDGKYLYLTGEKGNKSLILDALTGAQMGWFSFGGRGLAVSPDGKTLVQGSGNTVYVLNIEKSE